MMNHTQILDQIGRLKRELDTLAFELNKPITSGAYHGGYCGPRCEIHGTGCPNGVCGYVCMDSLAATILMNSGSVKEYYPGASVITGTFILSSGPHISQVDGKALEKAGYRLPEDSFSRGDKRIWGYIK